MLLKWPPTFFLQKAHSFDSKTSKKAYVWVSCKGCSQRHQGQGVQKVCPTRTSSGTLHAKKGSRLRNGFPSQEWPESQDYHPGRCGTTSPHLALQNVRGFSHACEFSPQRNQEMGHLQGLQGSPRGYVEQCKVAKQVKAALALFTAPTSKGKKDSKKASKKASRSPDVSAPVAGSVQWARKGYDSHGHVFSSSFSWSYWVHMYPWEIPCAIQQDSHKNKAGAKWPSNSATKKNHTKVHFEKSCELCKKHGGAHTTHATKDCHK